LNPKGGELVASLLKIFHAKLREMKFLPLKRGREEEEAISRGKVWKERGGGETKKT